jgi:cytochrome b
MKLAYVNTIINAPKTPLWSTAVRVLHWLTAISLLGAASYTEQNDSGHSELGWIALGLLLFLQVIYSYSGKTNWALWFVTTIVTAINMSGWLTPDHTSHILVTLSGVILAAFYIATVIFELISFLISRIDQQAHKM